MAKWEPENHHKDPMVNAILNVAEGLHDLASATSRLLYGLKYGESEGMSIAEAIEVSVEKVADAINSISSAIESRDFEGPPLSGDHPGEDKET